MQRLVGHAEQRSVGDAHSEALCRHGPGFHVDRIRLYTHVVSLDYLLSKVGAAVPAADHAAEAIRTVVPDHWRVPVNLGDNMHVIARRPA